jgi:Sulfotransferase family
MARVMDGGIFAALGQRAVNLLSLPDRMLRPEALMRRGGGPAGLMPIDIEAPLRVLLEDYRHHADLNLVGCFAARFDMLRLLRNLAALREREAQEPELLTAPVERPIFITGLPRSGTTFLHKLLAEDPENRSPAVWEAVFPLPRNGDDPPARRIATMDRQLSTFERMAPDFGAAHPIDALSPQECTEITAHVFRSFRFETMHHTPGYRDWLRAADHRPAYRFHRVFLQHLQHTDGRPRRWVLKSPDHVFTLEALASVYPDARVIFLHRDPLDVLASVAGLTAILRRPFTSRLDKAAIGRQVVSDWLEGTEAMMRAHAEHLFPEERVAHLRFRDLVSAPMTTVAALYERFGLPLGAEARQRMERRVAELPRGGYGGLTHALDDYGIDARAVRECFADYAACFGVQT